MKCERASELFSDFYDGELKGRVRNSLEKHLEICQKCNADYKNFVKSLKILKKMQHLDYPGDYLKKFKNDKRK
jgi:predicted anti-sigma-YlaC factor YlaD